MIVALPAVIYINFWRSRFCQSNFETIYFTTLAKAEYADVYHSLGLMQIHAAPAALRLRTLCWNAGNAGTARKIGEKGVS